MTKPLPPIGSQVRRLTETVAVKPSPLKGRIATVTQHFPGYEFTEDGERITVADAFSGEFDVETGYHSPDGPSYSLCFHCDENTWEKV